MITAQQRTALKKLLRGDYIADVKDKLTQRKIVSRKKTPYSDKMISHVFNGRYENISIEEAIIEVYLDRKKKMNNDHKWRNNILGISSPEDNEDDD